MEHLTEDELAEIRETHDRVESRAATADETGDDSAFFDDLSAHPHRGMLLGELERLLPVHEAAWALVRTLDRSDVPPAAQQALLDLQLALESGDSARCPASCGAHPRAKPPHLAGERPAAMF